MFMKLFICLQAILFAVVISEYISSYDVNDDRIEPEVSFYKPVCLTRIIPLYNLHTPHTFYALTLRV